MTKIVLQKLIAEAGLSSRRQAESFITGGKVTINGNIAKLGDRADDSDDVRVNGKRLVFTNKKVYITLHKPVGYVSTTRTFPGEHNVFELVKSPIPLSIVGRLDKDSEGLVLLTNDGELANRLTHPKFGVEKVYLATLAHDVALDKKLEKQKVAEMAKAFTEGVTLGEEGLVKAEKLTHLRGRVFEVVLKEGKKRQIRRMFRKLDCHVAKLVRIRLGNLTMGRLKEGQWRNLTESEVENLKKNVPYYQVVKARIDTRPKGRR